MRKVHRAHGQSQQLKSETESTNGPTKCDIDMAKKVKNQKKFLKIWYI